MTTKYIENEIKIVENQISELVEQTKLWKHDIWLQRTLFSRLNSLFTTVQGQYSVKSKIDTLQRYDMKVKWYTTLQYESYEVPSDNWEYVKYSDIVELLNR